MRQALTIARAVANASASSPFAKDTLAKLCKFVEEDCMPAQSTFHDQVSTDPALRWKSYPKIIEELKVKARSLGLWNLFLSKEHCTFPPGRSPPTPSRTELTRIRFEDPDVGVPLTNLEYAVMAEVMGRCKSRHLCRAFAALPVGRSPRA